MEQIRNTASDVISPPEENKTEEPNIIRFVVKPRQNVKWETGTIDNETMGKRKSKSKSIFKLSTIFYRYCCNQIPFTFHKLNTPIFYQWVCIWASHFNMN